MPTCGYCQDCKWWGDAVGCPIEWRDCLRFEKEETLLYGVDDHSDTIDSTSAIFTAPDFGCVQWEQKA